MMIHSQFSGTKSEYLITRRDYPSIKDDLATDYFEVRLTRESDVRTAINHECKVFCREIKTEEVTRRIYFLRVPKTAIFKCALHHEEEK